MTLAQSEPQIMKPNQFQEFIATCDNDPKQIQNAYEKHRSNRNAQFKERLLSPEFREWQFDEILEKRLAAEQGLTEYVDPRNNLAFWLRPPQHIRNLVAKIQQDIASVAGPCLWLTPPENLHMTTLEMLSARPASEVDEAVELFKKSLPLEDIVNYTFTHRNRLIRPIVSYDATAIALSFVPAAGEPSSKAVTTESDQYTYHHLRRDLWDVANQTGLPLASRYTVPSAHVTIARFAVPLGSDRVAGLNDLCKRANDIVARIEDINQELQSDDWRRFGDPTQGEWRVGEGSGLHFVHGRLWYGKCDDTVVVGKGFD